MRNYDDYTIDENVTFINELLDKGLTLKAIEEDYFGVQERVIYKRLTRKGYKRSNEGNKLFILVDSAKANREPNKPHRKRDKVSKDNSILSDNEIQKLKDLISKHDDIMYMLYMYSKCNTNDTQHIHNTNNTPVIQNCNTNDTQNCNTDDIQVIQTCNTKQRMFRIDVEVLEQWDKFCEEYKHIKIQSLISSALIEYISKYSKR